LLKPVIKDIMPDAIFDYKTTEVSIPSSGNNPLISDELSGLVELKSYNNYTLAMKKWKINAIYISISSAVKLLLHIKNRVAVNLPIVAGIIYDRLICPAASTNALAWGS